MWEKILPNFENINYTLINLGGCSSAVEYEIISHPTLYKSFMSKIYPDIFGRGGLRASEFM
jgi:hypothetical protein